MRLVRKLLIVAAFLGALALPATVLAGSDDAGPCGQYHGMFGPPTVDIGDHASSGYYKFGVIGDLNSNPICHQ